MKCHFVVGQKVTPIKRELSDFEKANVAAAKKSGVVFPVGGSVYTIREIGLVTTSDGVEMIVLRLSEIINKTMKFRNGKVGEIGFDATCFRVVIERKTDISIFTDMLIEQKQPVPA